MTTNNSNSFPPNDTSLKIQEENIDIKRYMSLFMSNWYLFAVALFIAMTLAYGINRYSQKEFSVSSSLLIKDDQFGGMGTIATSVIPGGDIFRSQQNVKNEMEILRSFQLNKRVIDSLNDFHIVYYGVGRRNIVESVLYRDCPFVVKYDSLGMEPKGLKVGVSVINENEMMIEILGRENSHSNLKFGETYSQYGFNFKIVQRDPWIDVYSERKSNNYYFYFVDPIVLANVYRTKLVVTPKSQESSVVSLSVTGNVKEQEIDYLNMLMDVYVESSLELKKEIATKTIEFINKQLAVIEDSLKRASDNLENFRTTNNFFDLRNEILIIQERLNVPYKGRADIEVQLQYLQYLLDYINSRDEEGTIASPSFIGISDQSLIALINELSSLQSEKLRQTLNFKEDINIIKFKDENIAIIKEAIKENIKNNIMNLRLSKIKTEEEISNIQSDYRKLPSTERQFVDIQRQFDLNNTIYTYLLEKRAESGIAQASTMADNRTVDYAQVRGQVKPRIRNNYLIALVLGLLIPGALIFLIDLFNNKVIDKKDIQRTTKVPVIGFIGHSTSDTMIAVVEKPSSSLSESFRSVRTSLKYYVKENEVTVISISSTISSEGKTFISINLAAIIAMLGKKVLLMGLDLRKPRLNKIFEVTDSPGMSSYLSGNCEYEDVIKTTLIENLYYAPSGAVPPNPAELIETTRMGKFMEQARKEYDYIIFDTPPVAIVTDSILLSRYADVNLFIVRQRYSSVDTLDVIEQLRLNGELKNMAIIINDISLSGYYGYGLRYSYYYGYGYTYGSAYYDSNYYRKYGKSGMSYNYYAED